MAEPQTNAVSNGNHRIGNQLSGFPDILPIPSPNDKAAFPLVSVIIPTLNEAENLPLILPYLPMNWVDEVVLVDGRSTDGTIEVAKKLLPSIVIVKEEMMGKGAALRAGYLASGGDILIVLDADGSHDPREIPRFILALLEGADFVKGSRFAPGGGTTDMPWFRKAGNGSFVSLSNILFGVRFTDLCYGYHAFWRYCLDVIDLDEFNGFEIDTALYLQAVRMKLHIVDVPSFEGYRFYGKGKLQTIPDGFRVLTTILHQWLKTLSDHKRQFPACFRGNRYSHPKMIDLDREIQVHHHLPDLFQFLSTLIFSGVMQHGILEQLIKMVLNMVSVDSGSLILLDENGAVSEGCLVSKGGFHMPEMNAWTNLLQEGLAGWVVQNCATAVVYNTNNDPRWLRRTWDQGGRTAVALPLVVGGLVVGVLTLTRPARHPFTNEEVSLLDTIPMIRAKV